MIGGLQDRGRDAGLGMGGEYLKEMIGERDVGGQSE